MSDDEIINHEEARELAQTRLRDSNLARCYLDLVSKLQEAAKEVTEAENDARQWAKQLDQQVRVNRDDKAKLKECESRLSEALERDRKGDTIILELTHDRDQLARRLGRLMALIETAHEYDSASYFGDVLKQSLLGVEISAPKTMCTVPGCEWHAMPGTRRCGIHAAV